MSALVDKITQQFQSAITGLREDLHERAIYKAAPRIALPVISARHSEPVSAMTETFKKHEVASCRILAERLYHAQYDEVRLRDILSEAEIKTLKHYPASIGAFMDAEHTRITASMFETAGKAQGVSRDEAVLTRITLGEDPFHGRDRYTHNAIGYGPETRVFYSPIPLSDLLGYIDHEFDTLLQAHQSAPDAPSIAA